MARTFTLLDHLITTKMDWVVQKGVRRYSELSHVRKSEKITECQHEALLNTLQDMLRKELEHQEFEAIRRRECLKKAETFRTIAKALRRKGERGSAHQVYARALEKSRIYFAACFLAEAVAEDQGCTIHPFTLQDTGFTGFVVSTNAERKAFTKKPTKAAIKKYLEKYKDALNFARNKKDNTDLYVGISKHGNTWLLEQSYICENYSQANSRAVLEEQETLYDFKYNRTIDVQYPIYPEPK